MAQTNEEAPVAIDFSGLTPALTEAFKEQTKGILEALKPSEPQGNGFVMPTADASKLLESLHRVQENNWKLEEQWTVVIPNYRQKENKANLRDFVYVSEILKSEPGDVLKLSVFD